MPVFSSADSTLHYETYGAGPPLVLIHAISAGAGMWEPQIREFAATHRVIAFDARGVGRSGPIRGWRHVCQRMADDVARLLDHVGEDAASVCGVSFGGVIAQEFAARHPERVTRLDVVDTYSDSRPTSLGRLGWLISAYLGSTANLMPRRLLSRIMRAQGFVAPLRAIHGRDGGGGSARHPGAHRRRE